MNIYIKYAPNVFIAQCDERHQKGDVILVETKYGKEHECRVHNFIGRHHEKYCYSITRVDGFDNRKKAQAKVDKLNSCADNAEKRGDEWQEKSNEGKEFLALGEPIKVGHHSEKWHRSLIERNWRRMENAMEEFKKAEGYRKRTDYWEALADKIDLSMPESIEFFKAQLDEAEICHAGLKSGAIPKEHAFSLSYAAKKVKELKTKYELAVKLWGDNNED